MTRADQVKAKRRRQEDRRAKFWDRVADTLSACGMKNVRSADAVFRQRMLALCLPAPEIIPDPSLGPDKLAAVAAGRQALSDAIGPLNGQEISWGNAYSVVLPWARKFPDQVAIQLRNSALVTGEPADPARLLESELMVELDRSVGSTVCALAGPEEDLFWYRRQTDPRGRIQIVLGKVSSESATATIDGCQRPAYRCGGSADANGFRWIEWPAWITGGPAESSNLPVYIQSHAIMRLRERLPIGPAQAHWSLLRSLARPVIVQRDVDTLLTEYRALDVFKVGYLVPEGCPTKSW